MGASVRPEPIDEKKIPPADLWDQKIAEGLSPDSATAYVARIHGAPPAAAPARQPLIRNTAPSTVARADATASDRQRPADYYADDLPGALRTIEQGATFGFGDELNASVRSLMPGQTLADALADERKSVAGFRERHPAASFGAEILGGMGGGAAVGAGVRALRGGATAVNTASAPVRALKSTATAAAAGGAAAAGASDGDISDRIRAIPMGMAFGAATAGVMNTAGATAKAGGRLLSNRASKPTMVGRALRSAGIPTAGDLAKGDILRQLERGGLTLDDAERAAQLDGPEAMLLDVGGGGVLRRTRGVHAIPSKGSEQIEQALTERVANQPGRVQALVSRGVNSGQPRENAVLAARKLIDDRRAAAAPLYEKAYAGAPIEDPEVHALFKNHEQFRDAYAEAQRLAHLEDPTNPLPNFWDMVDEGGKQVPAMRPIPIKALDGVKKGLDALIEKRAGSANPISRTEARLLRNKLRGALERVDETNPEYKAARAQFAGDSQLLDAHERGREFLKMSKDELAADWPSMSEGERALFRRGAMSELSTELSKVTDGRDVTRIFQNPLMRERLALILPDQAEANVFFKQLASETDMHKRATFVRGGSPTARIEAEKADALQEIAEPFVHAVSGRPAAAAGSLFSRFANAETRGLTEAQADALAPMLTARGDDLAKTFADLRQFGARTGRAQAQRAAAVRSTAQTVGGAAPRKR